MEIRLTKSSPVLKHRNQSKGASCVALRGEDIYVQDGGGNGGKKQSMKLKYK